MIQALELFCGIGGFSAAAPELDVVLAVDQSRPALATYSANLAHPTRAWNLDHVRPEALDVGADLWWLSPPCQPYTIRGAGRALGDPRARSFRAVVEAIRRLQPRWVAMENVPPFAGSAAEALLRDALPAHRIESGCTCPTELGIPMRRRRFYLVAGRDPLPLDPWPVATRPLAAYLDEAYGVDEAGVPPARPVPPAVATFPAPRLDAWRHAIHVVDPDDPSAVANCFTSAYGRSPVRAGSYVRVADGLRHFRPREIARLLGFPERWHLPEDPHQAWPLLGNSLSVHAVRAALTRFGR